ncbi:hypothetical protein ACHFJ0_09710 [Paracoccus sp. NGMCC 1.201697]|uniref:Ribbon-helix-helix protein, CopG family n=1 Tax=Paracoccus broussonetiae subsp. drimophilus TaxID=3373869 RepID=A0ABW7LK48_9RHOB
MSEDFDASRKPDLKQEAAEAEERAAKKRAEAEHARKLAEQSLEAASAAEKAAAAAEAEARAARDRIGRTPRVRPERRSDQLSVRATTSLRDRVESEAKAEGIAISEYVERAMMAYFRSKEN